MPVPIELSNSLRRMSTITVPKQDINFDSYDFQLCLPQTDIKDTFESRELEAAFCRDFACCGLVLNDLHDLLQHYEECHVRLEDDDASLYDDSESGYWSPPSLSYSCSSSAASSVDGSAPSSPVLSTESVTPDIHLIKKKAAAYLSDLYNSNPSSPVSLASSSLSSPCSSAPVSPLSLDDDVLHPIDIVDDEATLPKKSVGKKRSYTQMSNTTALDLLTQSAAKKLALASHSLGDLNTPILTDEDFLAQAGALLASTHANANADKPYKCPVPGCDKAYKNPNGLKYHNQHGHCNLVNDEYENMASKPYQCTIGDCGKRYKNLNGLKYHIEHSHMAALNHTLATFGHSIFNTPSAVPTPEASPVLSAASLPSLF
ncbi:uncharacterized protein BYT42DRAFT_560550 [Radiomyces spectabilis]|uniref:uncharacterized protein n=1 Tax=Radiomyces spectabilis TaxID=64574 RepID=UPI00221F4E8F|nr:uncharacterized protein BYT42DRAFT_560550 [Radiomyces spectabilis]KAI8388574.1 hypothetical protein BYT42DRAFT_560550 [Radiomyces spectabilis]